MGDQAISMHTISIDRSSEHIKQPELDMKKSLHQLLSKNPQLRVLAFHGKEAPFTIKKGNQEKLLAYTGGGMSPPPLGTS